MIKFLCIIGLSIFLFSGIEASDMAKEKRWAEQVEDGLLDGDAVYLNDGTNMFLAIDTRPENATTKAVILLHGIGAHPDWPQVISPLRVGLPENGWATLSLQLPILVNDARAEDYQPLLNEVPPRLDAGLSHLNKAGFDQIHIVAHSMGTLMTNHYLANRPSKQKPAIKSYVAIGMGTGTVPYLGKITLPILDLFGEDDLEGVLNSSKARADAATNNKFYRQTKVNEADHFFNDRENELLMLVLNWLNHSQTD